MRYRTFKGKTRQEAFAQLNLEKKSDPDLREARLIKHSEGEISSFMGFKKETVYEIVVGIPEHSFSVSAPTTICSDLKKEQPLQRINTIPAFTAIEKSIINNNRQISSDAQDTLFALESVSRVADQISKFNSTHNNGITPKKNVLTKNRGIESKEIEHLKLEISEIKTECTNLQKLLKSHIENVEKNIAETRISDFFSEIRALPNDYKIYQQHIRWLEKYLAKKEFSTLFIDDIIKHLEKSPEVLKNKDLILEKVREFVHLNIPLCNISLDNYGAGNNIIFVGPTGVGKTSTLVKLATHLGSMRNNNFQFVSIDPSKIGKEETQLERLTNHMNVPFYQISKKEALIHLLDNSEEKGMLTFIDTVGKSPKDITIIQELSQWTSIIRSPIDIHLVISATTKSADLDYMCDSYTMINYNHILITKLDETKTYGSILSAAYKYKKSLSFMTDGQEIPQDFSIIDLKRLINDSLSKE